MSRGKKEKQEAGCGMQMCVSGIEEAQWLNERSPAKHAAHLTCLHAAAKRSSARRSPTGNQLSQSPAPESSRRARQPAPDSTRIPAAYPIPRKGTRGLQPRRARGRCASASRHRRADAVPIALASHLIQMHCPRTHTHPQAKSPLRGGLSSKCGNAVFPAPAHSCQLLAALDHFSSFNADCSLLIAHSPGSLL